MRERERGEGERVENRKLFIRISATIRQRSHENIAKRKKEKKKKKNFNAKNNFNFFFIDISEREKRYNKNRSLFTQFHSLQFQFYQESNIRQL